MIIYFCGHSDFKETKQSEQKIVSFLEKTIGDNNADMYLGGYGNFDEFAYKCCKKYKESHSNVSLIFVTPYLTFQYQKNHLLHLKCRYDAVIYPEIEEKPLRFAILYRNKWMVEKADYVVCAIERSFGGAYKIYLYAQRKKKIILMY